MEINYPTSELKASESDSASIGINNIGLNHESIYNQKEYSLTRNTKAGENKDCSDKLSDNLDKSTGRWTQEEHFQFLKGCLIYGKSWHQIKDCVKSRSSTQIRSHCQKFLIKLVKKFKRLYNKTSLPNNKSNKKPVIIEEHLNFSPQFLSDLKYLVEMNVNKYKQSTDTVECNLTTEESIINKLEEVVLQIFKPNIFKLKTENDGSKDMFSIIEETKTNPPKLKTFLHKKRPYKTSIKNNSTEIKIKKNQSVYKELVSAIKKNSGLVDKIKSLDESLVRKCLLVISNSNNDSTIRTYFDLLQIINDMTTEQLELSDGFFKVFFSCNNLISNVNTNIDINKKYEKNSIQKELLSLLLDFYNKINIKGQETAESVTISKILNNLTKIQYVKGLIKSLNENKRLDSQTSTLDTVKLTSTNSNLSNFNNIPKNLYSNDNKENDLHINENFNSNNNINSFKESNHKHGKGLDNSKYIAVSELYDDFNSKRNNRNVFNEKQIASLESPSDLDSKYKQKIESLHNFLKEDDSIIKDPQLINKKLYKDLIDGTLAFKKVVNLNMNIGDSPILRNYISSYLTNNAGKYKQQTSLSLSDMIENFNSEINNLIIDIGLFESRNNLNKR